MSKVLVLNNSFEEECYEELLDEIQEKKNKLQKEGKYKNVDKYAIWLVYQYYDIMSAEKAYDEETRKTICTKRQILKNKYKNLDGK